MGSKYDQPLTITVTAEDWQAARAEELFQERIAKKAERLSWQGPEYAKLEKQEKEYSCICVVAQALVRQIPKGTRSGVKDAVSVSASTCSVKFRDGTKREYRIDQAGQEIIERFDSKVQRPKGQEARAPMPPALRQGVQVTLEPTSALTGW